MHYQNKQSMKTLEDIFSSKEQEELLDKYEDALFRQFQAEMEVKSIKQALLDTLPIKRGVWFKYGEHSGVIKNTMLDNDLETMYIRSNNMWSVGCFYGTGEGLIAKAYKDSEISGREYERVVKYVESILKDNNYDKRRNREDFSSRAILF